jgi:hypothetical protein
MERGLNLSAVRRKLDRLFPPADGGWPSLYNPPAAEQVVAGLERMWGVTLPPAYRQFLTQIGNGGPGPEDLELFPLGPTGEGRWDGYVGDLAAPFPYAEAWNEDPPDDPEQQARWREWYFSPARVDGAIPIADEGCGYLILLVVSGPERGNVWKDGRGGTDGVSPLWVGDQEGVSFAEWYEGWLDRELAGGREGGQAEPAAAPPPAVE